MNFFLDTSDVKQIAEFYEMGLVAGVTTNPSILAKAEKGPIETLREICAIVDGPVSAEVVAADYEGMIMQAEKLIKISDNIVIKLPITMDGIKACHKLSKQDINVNMTLCFSAAQASLAAVAGATFVSPFIGRLDDIGLNGMELINEISLLYGDDEETLILAASIRNINHVVDAFKAGADVVTFSPEIMRQLFKHPLTDKGLEIFMNDWNSANKKL